MPAIGDRTTARGHPEHLGTFLTYLVESTAEKIVSVLNIRYPIPQCFIDRIL